MTEETDGAIHSYKLCFYVDTAIAAFLLLMAASGRKSANTYGAAISVFSHGVFHMSQYVFGWPPLPSHIDVIIGPFFTLCMLLGFGYGNTVGNTTILIAMVAVLEAVRMMFVPIHYTFAYINGWIYAVATIAGVSIGRKANPMVRASQLSFSQSLPVLGPSLFPCPKRRVVPMAWDSLPLGWNLL